MNVKQNLSILFYLKRKKKSQDGKIPIYARVTIDGLQEEISTGEKVLSTNWVNETKTADSRDRESKKINKKLSQLRVDLERHFDLMQAKHEVATPALVIHSLRSPLNGSRIQQEKVENLALSEKVDVYP